MPCSVPTDRDPKSCRVVAGTECRVLQLQLDGLSAALLWSKASATGLQEFLGALGGAARHFGDFCSRWSGQSTKDERAPGVAGVLPHVHSVQGEHMVVNIEPDGAIHPLHRGDRTAKRVGNGLEPMLLLGAPFE
jgi:hypothetical protein